MNEIIFDNIRAEIKRRRWSIDDFCKKLNVPRTRFYRWEEKGDFPTSYLVKMSEIFEISTDELIGISKKSA